MSTKLTDNRAHTQQAVREMRGAIQFLAQARGFVAQAAGGVYDHKVITAQDQQLLKRAAIDIEMAATLAQSAYNLVRREASPSLANALQNFHQFLRRYSNEIRNLGDFNQAHTAQVRLGKIVSAASNIASAVGKIKS